MSLHASRRIALGALAIAAVGACSASHATDALSVGRDGTGGASSDGTGGSTFLFDASAGRALAAHIEHDHVAVSFVTLHCAGECADVEAVATGGVAPYSFAWEDGSTSPARTVCPTESTNYEVAVTDQGVASGEFKRDPDVVKVPLTANVLDCTDAGARLVDGAACVSPNLPAPGRYLGTIQCPSPPSSGGAANATGKLWFDIAADGTGTLFFQWSLVVIGAQGNYTGGADCVSGGLHSRWTGVWGVPGLPDPNRPNDPPGLIPAGPVFGEFIALPVSGSPTKIAGNFYWNSPPVADQPASLCQGNFEAELAP